MPGTGLLAEAELRELLGNLWHHNMIFANFRHEPEGSNPLHRAVQGLKPLNYAGNGIRTRVSAARGQNT